MPMPVSYTHLYDCGEHARHAQVPYHDQVMGTALAYERREHIERREISRAEHDGDDDENEKEQRKQEDYQALVSNIAVILFSV